MAGSKKISIDERKQFQEMELLLRVAKQVAVIDTMDELLSTIVDISATETGADRGVLFLNDENRGEVYSRLDQGPKLREIRTLNNQGIAGYVFNKGEGAIVQDAYADPRFDRAIDEETGYVTKSVVCAPIRTAKGEVIGVLHMLNKKNGEFTPEDLHLPEAMTRQTAITLRNHQFVENMKVSREQEMKFLDLLADITSDFDLSAMLSKIVREAANMLRADRATLFLNDEKKKELFSRVAMGDKVGEIRLPNHLGIAGAVFTTGQTVNIPYAYADLRFNPAFDKKSGYFTRSILCVPVVNKVGKVIGVTQVLNKRGGPFSDEDESRLKAFTGQVSIALQNAKLFDDVPNMKNYNEGMLESMSNAVITTNEDGLIVTCNNAGHRIMKVKAADIVFKPFAAFFGGANTWVADKAKEIGETNTSFEMMDAEME